jgi:hypothetical protein
VKHEICECCGERHEVAVIAAGNFFCYKCWHDCPQGEDGCLYSVSDEQFQEYIADWRAFKVLREVLRGSAL